MAQVQKALFLVAKQGSFALRAAPIPRPGPGEVLLKQAAIGLNPVDAKIQALGFFIKEYPAILGLDLAGTVEEVGEGVTNVKKGDRVQVHPSLSPLPHTLTPYLGCLRARLVSMITARTSSMPLAMPHQPQRYCPTTACPQLTLMHPHRYPPACHSTKQRQSRSPSPQPPSHFTIRKER